MVGAQFWGANMDYAKLTVSQLKEELKAKGIEFPGKMLKSDLVELLKHGANDPHAAPPPSANDIAEVGTAVEDGVETKEVPIKTEALSDSGNLAAPAPAPASAPRIAFLGDEEEDEEEDEELTLENTAATTTRATTTTTTVVGADTKTKDTSEGLERDEIAAAIDDNDMKDAYAEKQQISGTKSDIEEGTKIIEGMGIEGEEEEDGDDSLDEEEDTVKIVIGSRNREKNLKRKSFSRGIISSPLVLVSIHTFIHVSFFISLNLTSLHFLHIRRRKCIYKTSSDWHLRWCFFHSRSSR